MGAPTRILIVEDEWLIAEDYATRLRGAGHHVVGPVPSVAKALQAIDEEQIDLALLDIELRGETSYPVAERLRERAIPFAFLSGYAGQQLPAAMQGADVIAKPVEQGQLVAAVQRMSKAV